VQPVRTLLAATLLVGLAVLAACPPHNDPQPVPPAPKPATGWTPPASIDGGPAAAATCLTDADCGGGVCEGLGCGDDAPGQCVTADRRCTRDQHAYCGCDGQTFNASGTCPGRRYASDGACAP
jgi:hypothetical protein